MTGPAPDQSLRAIRHLEREMGERRAQARAEADQRLILADKEAGRMVTIARRRGLEEADRRTRARLAETDALADQIRSEAAARSARFRQECADRLDELASRLVAAILPGEP